jgi:protein HIRA/HIR1
MKVSTAFCTTSSSAHTLSHPPGRPAGAIYAVHAQPKGPRFATGGFDQRVKIWNLSAALDAKVEAQPGTNKLLAMLGEHTGAVNAVRFSHDGKLLASGSDDAAVIVYHLLPGAGGGTLGSTATSVENWRPKVVLRGHASNVTDLAWSHDDAKLATASTDGNVIVWDMPAGHRLATLTAQKSFVKGVQWDPVGSYLVAQVRLGVAAV